MGYAIIHIIGNLGGDPEMRYTPNGKAVTQFNVAVSHSKRNESGGWDEETDWYRCSVWGNSAERVAEKFRKGDKIAVYGRFKTREFQGRDGAMRTSLEISVDSHQDLVKRQRGEGSYGGEEHASAYNGPAPAAPSGNADIDDLPF